MEKEFNALEKLANDIAGEPKTRRISFEKPQVSENTIVVIQVDKEGMTTDILVDASNKIKEALGINVLFISKEASLVGIFDLTRPTHNIK